MVLKPVRGSLFIVTIFILLTSLLLMINQTDNARAGRNVPLPKPLAQSSAAVIDGNIYIFGGQNANETHDRIMLVDPTEDTIETLNVILPYPLNNPTVFSDGSRAYILGGEQGIPGNETVCYPERSRNLTIFTPPNIINTFPDFFPYGLEGNAVAYDGNYFFLFGNCMCSTDDVRRNVIRFDPLELEFDISKNVLPLNLSGASAVWYDEAAYIFGGKSDKGKILDTIIRYDQQGECKILDIHLPEPVYKMGVARRGAQVYILGGITPQGLSDQFLMMDLDEQKVQKTGFYLCQPRASRAVVTVDDDVYLIGGDTTTGAAETMEIVILPEMSENTKENGENSGDIVLTAGIIGSIIMLSAVAAIYVLDYRRYRKDKSEIEEKKGLKESKEK